VNNQRNDKAKCLTTKNNNKSVSWLSREYLARDGNRYIFPLGNFSGICSSHTVKSTHPSQDTNHIRRFYLTRQFKYTCQFLNQNSPKFVDM
jgi:hypothetical protein